MILNKSLPLIKRLDKNRELKLIGYTERNLILYITQIGYIGAYYHSKPSTGRGLGTGQIKELLILKDYIKFSRYCADIDSPRGKEFTIKTYSWNQYSKESFDLDNEIEKIVIRELEKCMC